MRSAYLIVTPKGCEWRDPGCGRRYAFEVLKEPVTDEQVRDWAAVAALDFQEHGSTVTAFHLYSLYALSKQSYG